MTNVGKRRYEEIPVPEELEWAVTRACRRAVRRRAAQRWLSGAAAALALLIACANVAPLYASAAEVPILGQVVRMMRIGSGGHNGDAALVSAYADGRSAEICFYADDGAAAEVPAYSVVRRTAPSRVILRFHAVEEVDTASWLTAFSSMSAVADVYPNVYPTAGDQGITLVLNRGFDCSVQENQSPGTLSVTFYSGESAPDVISYFLRSPAMPPGKELEDLAQQLSWEGATQVRTASGLYCVVLGNYRTEQRAREAKAGLEKKLGKSLDLSVACGGTYEIPEN